MKIEQLISKTNSLLTTIGEAIGAALPPGKGFALLFFDFGPGGEMSYASNGNRQDMVKALKEAVKMIEGAGC